MKGSLNPVLHQLAECTRLVGMYHRLRCPKCNAVGTWKPHGGWFEPNYRVRRWMCKWCGYYRGPEGPNGEVRVAPDPRMGVWRDRSLVQNAKTPAEVVNEHPSTAKCWPWRG